MKNVAVNKGSENLPAGYELVRFDFGLYLALPNAQAPASRAELDRRDILEAEARSDELARQREKTKAKSLEKKNAEAACSKTDAEELKRALAEPPEPGWYRVLPNLDTLLDERSAVGSTLRSADDDVNRRNAKLRDVLIEKGPDRRVSRNELWREGLAELDAALPHFHAPIRLLRNTLALSEATGRPVRVPPMLLLGPPGVGKTYFSHRVAELLGAPHATVAFDQPSASSELRGSQSHWSNSSTGLLFNMICLGGCANPIVLLDEIDKACVSGSLGEQAPLSQLHGALEPETSRDIEDVSVHIKFDASLTTYIGTANSANGISLPILSRMEVFSIEEPSPSESVDVARAIVEQSLKRLGLSGRMTFDRKSLYVLAHMSPRLMMRTVEKAAAEVVVDGREQVRESDVWAVTRLEARGPRWH